MYHINLECALTNPAGNTEMGQGVKVKATQARLSDGHTQISDIWDFEISHYEKCEIHMKTGKSSSKKHPQATHSANYLAQDGHVNTTPQQLSLLIIFYKIKLSYHQMTRYLNNMAWLDF